MSDILEKLRKIREMAEHGGGSEQDRVHAKNKLEQLLKQYKLTHEEVFKDESKKRWIRFWARDNWCREILFGCYMAVTGNQTIVHKKFGKRHIYFELTEWEGIELGQMFDYHKKLWTKQLHDVSLAFLVKHELYSRRPREDDDDDTQPMDIERVHRLQSIMGGMHDGKYISTKRMLPDSHE